MPGILRVVLVLALAAAPALAGDGLESEVAAIERLGVTAPWQESSAAIDALLARAPALSAEQRWRLELVQLRNRGIAGRQDEALRGLARLLEEEALPPELRLRAYTSGISMAANLEDWTLAFTWLGDGLALLPKSTADSPGFIGSAAYLHSLVGETEKALELGRRAVVEAEAGDDGGVLCRALSELALAETDAGNFGDAEALRRRQVAACTAVGDRVFAANGQYGIGQVLHARGRHEEALRWAEQALSEYRALGFDAGVWSASLGVGEALVALERDPERAEALLLDVLRYYQGSEAHLATAKAARALVRMERMRDRPERALDYVDALVEAQDAAVREARERQLAYLQVQFDTRLKEQQIALLEAERALAELQVTATQRRQWLLGLGVFALLVIAVLLAVLLRHTRRERQRYRRQSERDGLTGLYNYQQVRRLGEEAFARARSEGRPFTVVVADIDRFKQVNDRHGHAAGDEALRALGRWISEVAGARGICGRIGGDEFTILVEADAAEAGAMVEELRARLRPVSLFGQSFGFDISAGVRQDDGRIGSFEQLVHEADLALYRAKQDGQARD